MKANEAESSSSTASPSSTAATPLPDPTSQKYMEKYTLLMQKYKYIRLSNDKLKNRLYHVKKEIKHLKRLKRILCQRLLLVGDRFMDSCLEIPDNEPGSNVADKIIADVASIAGSQSSTAPRRRSRPDHRRKEQSQEIQSIADAAKLSVSSIIDSVITESHEERLLARGDGKGPLEDGTDPSMITDGAGGLLSPCRSESTVDSEIANDYAYMAALVDPTTTDTDPPEE